MHEWPPALVVGIVAAHPHNAAGAHISNVTLLHVQAKKEALQARASQPTTPRALSAAATSPSGSPNLSPRSGLNELITQASTVRKEPEQQPAAADVGQQTVARPEPPTDATARLSLGPAEANGQTSPRRGIAVAAAAAAKPLPSPVPSIFAGKWAQQQQSDADLQPDRHIPRLDLSPQPAPDQQDPESPAAEARPSTPPAQQPPRPPARSVFADRWTQSEAEPRPSTPPAQHPQPPRPPAQSVFADRCKQPAAEPQPPMPLAQQPPRPPAQSVFADKWKQPEAETQLSEPPAQPPPQPPAQSLFTERWKQPEEEPQPPSPSAQQQQQRPPAQSVFVEKWKQPVAEPQPPLPIAQQPQPPTSSKSIFADKWAGQPANGSAVDNVRQPASPAKEQAETSATSFVQFAAAARKRTPSSSPVGSPPGGSAAPPKPPALLAISTSATGGSPEQNGSSAAPAGQALHRNAPAADAFQPAPATAPQPASPAQASHPAGSPRGAPVRSYSHFDEAQRSRHEQTLAVVAASRERWGNQPKCVACCTYPQWQFCICAAAAWFLTANQEVLLPFVALALHGIGSHPTLQASTGLVCMQYLAISHPIDTWLLCACCRFPEWQPPPSPRGNQLPPQPMSLVQRIQWQKEQAAAAAGGQSPSPRYSGPYPSCGGFVWRWLHVGLQNAPLNTPDI